MRSSTTHLGGAAGSRKARRGRLAGAAVLVAALAVTGATVAWLNFDRGSGGGPAARTTATARDPAATPPATPPATPSSSPPGAYTPATGSPDADARIPESFAGSWSGQVTSTNPLVSGTKEIRVELVAGEREAGWAEPSNGCTGRIALQESTATTLTFALGDGTGCVPGTVWLAKKADLLTYTWRDVPGLGIVTETGDLGRR